MKKILAIDDQLDNLTTIKAVIKSQLSDCIVLTATSGKEGIEIAEKEQPDTILLDIIMPQMDGYETCKRLKKNKLTKHIPVVMVTAIKTDSESKVKGLNMGADAFLSKPIDAIELTAQLNVMFRIKEAEDKLRAEKEGLETIVLSRTLELRTSEQKYKTLYDFAPIPYQSLNEDGSIDDINPAWLNLLGYERKEVIGELYMDFIHPDDKPVLSYNFPVLLNEGFVHEVPFRLRHKEGHYIDISLEGCSSYNPDNKSKQTYCVFQDITKRKKAEKQIRKLSTAIEQSPSVIVITDLLGVVEYVNPKFTTLTGYTLEEAIGENPRILKSGDQSEKVYKEMWKTITKGKEWHGEFHNKKKNGKLFWESVSISPIFDNQGKITNYLKVAEDITEQRETKIALIDSEERLKILFESAPDAFYISDLKGTFLDGNKAAEKIMGYKKEELIGKNFLKLKLLSAKDFPKAIKSLAKNVVGEETGPDEFLLNRKDGSKIPVEISTFPVKIKNKTVILGIARDITKRKQQDKELSEQRQRLSHIVEGTNAGTWDWNIQTGELVLNEQWAKIMGRTLKELEPINVKTWEENTHPDDQPILNNLLNKHFNKELDYYDAEFRQLHKDGHWIWINARGRVIEWDEAGKPLRMSGTHIDITEQKLSEDAIRKSEALYRNLVHVIPDGVYKSTDEGKFVSVNPAMVKMLGYASKEELLAIDIKTQLYFDIVDRESAVLQENLEETGIFRMKKKDGSEIWVEDHGWLTVDEETKTIFHEGIMRDITERKRAEEIQNVLYNISNAVITTNDIKDLIHIVQKELGKIIDTKNFYVALYDSKTNTISSPYMADEKDSFTNFPAGKTLTYYVIKTQKPLLATKERLKELEDSGDIEGIGSDSEIWLGVPLKIEGKVTGVFAVQSYTDEHAYDEADMEVLEFIADQISISIERKTAEDLLKKSEERFDLAVNASQDGLYDWNLITDEVYYSEQWKAMLGYTDDELPNDLSVWESLSHKEEKEASLNILKEAIEQKIDHYDVEFRMKHKLGHWVNILSRARLIYDEDGKAIRAVGTHTDLTEQKKAEQNLKEAKDKAEESDRLKSAFLANMSHEIRTPMNGILGFTSLLKEPDLTSNEKDNYIKIIEKSGKRMLTTINNIVDISKIEAGQMEVSISDFSINKQIEFLYTFFKPETQKKGIELSYKNGLPKNEDSITSDMVKVNAILTNLIKNAIKYSHKGSIDFGYQIIEDKDLTSLQFYVKDKGIGIPKDRQKAVFDRFVQADIEDKQVYEGSGLGLTISKAYVEMLGGTIWLESEEGEGSQFYFTLPFKSIKNRKHQEEQTTSKSILTEIPRKLSILVAEDDETSGIYLKTLTRGIYKDISFVKTGTKAVEICKEKTFDLILMDIKMPEMSGYEATRKIREFNKDIVIIAQTAYALSGDRELSLEAGCNDYISKPINKNKLMEMIWKHVK